MQPDLTQYTTKELFDEILNLQEGDLWDGVKSSYCESRLKLFLSEFANRMRAAGIDWD